METLEKKIAIVGNVILRSRVADSESDNVGLSLLPIDDQNIHLEILAPKEVADQLNVDRIYQASFTQDLTDGHIGFKVHHCVVVSGAKSSVRMVAHKAGSKGVQGNISLDTKFGQSKFFDEQKDFTLVLEEVDAEA